MRQRGDSLESVGGHGAGPGGGGVVVEKKFWGGGASSVAEMDKTSSIDLAVVVQALQK